jgi:predicted DNA-binding protein (MmcQ/YjbR family)
MTIEEIQTICKKLKGVTEDIKWENHLCFNIGGKMFLVTAPDAFPVTASIKVSNEDFTDLPSKNGFSPAPYLARYKWIFIDDINLWSAKQWEKFIRSAYHEVAAKLPLKVRKEIGLSEQTQAPDPQKKRLKRN